MKVGIIGGGASGLILASKLNNYDVTIYERNDVLGKKLSLTGNGKCNFTNKCFDNLDDCYNNDFAKKIYLRYDNYSFIKFMNDIGIYEKTEVHKGISYIYPNTNSAKSVCKSLEDKIKSKNVAIRNNKLIDKIIKNGDKFIIDGESYDKIIFATGGMTYNKTGSDGLGYEIIKTFGHKIIKPIPALSALKIDKNISSILKGIRVDAKTTAKYLGDDVYSESGEVQFTDFGISGIPIMNATRYINRLIDNGKHIEIILDFSNGLSYENFKYMILKTNYKNSFDILSGILPKNLSEFIYKRVIIDYKNIYRISDLPEEFYKKIYDNIINFKLDILGYAPCENAQITLGGVSIDDIDNETLESKIVKNLYFVGEVMDIDGKCGGYNLQMCYSTASVVAEAINKEV